MCIKCHRLGGAGGSIGPDLSNISQRDYESVLKDIVNPSAAINPDYVAYTITMKDGREFKLLGICRRTHRSPPLKAKVFRIRVDR